MKLEFKRMNKKQWIHYIIRFFLVWILLFGVKFYKETHPKYPDIISSEDIQTGNYFLINENLDECGQIAIKKDEINQIIINLSGSELKGINSINKPYLLQPIEYENIVMNSISENYETFYLYDSGTSYVLLFKVRNSNSYFLKKDIDLKKNNIYMISVISYDKYNFIEENKNSMEIQNWCHSSRDTNRYTCYFIQERK